MANPFVVIHQYADDAFAAFVHLDQKVRSVFGANAADIERRLVNTHIAEFGMSQADAETAAKAAVEPLVNPPEPPEDLSGQLADLKARHADLDQKLTEATQRAVRAESDLTLARSDNSALKATLAKASPAEAEPVDQGGSVSTPPVETPAPDPEKPDA